MYVQYSVAISSTAIHFQPGLKHVIRLVHTPRRLEQSMETRRWHSLIINADQIICRSASFFFSATGRDGRGIGP